MWKSSWQYSIVGNVCDSPQPVCVQQLTVCETLTWPGSLHTTGCGVGHGRASQWRVKLSSIHVHISQPIFNVSLTLKHMNMLWALQCFKGFEMIQLYWIYSGVIPLSILHLVTNKSLENEENCMVKVCIMWWGPSEGTCVNCLWKNIFIKNNPQGHFYFYSYLFNYMHHIL